jgi:serine/threonine protein kinase
MSQQKLSWVGLLVEDSIVDANLGEGSFSFIFKGTDRSTGTPTAFKLAKARDLVERISDSRPGATKALSFFTGGTRNVRPDAEELLARQFEKLQSAPDSALVRVDKLSQQSGLCYYQMEFLSGSSLRQIIANGNASLSLFANLAVILDRLTQDKTFAYHGDLKPENIIVDGAKMKLIDPGYFGPLRCQEGSMSKVAITTTCYYPSLTPDDLYAFGIMLWESCLGRHPLLPGGSEVPVSDTLKQKVKRLSAVGFYGFEPLLSLKRPTEIRPGLKKDMEDFLLKGLRLRINENNLLDETKGFASFAAFHQQIMALQSAGLDSSVL